MNDSFNIFFDQPVLLMRGFDYRFEASCFLGPSFVLGKTEDNVLCSDDLLTEYKSGSINSKLNRTLF